jgi:muramoyltetrapeptide carboxypeptidase
MITPPYLKPGDKIGIVAPARKVSPSDIASAIDWFERQGWQVCYNENLFHEYHQLSGTDEERAANFQEMLNDESIRAIFCARGGYGTVRMIDYLDFSPFIQNPKWIVGFSDITVLHSHIHSNFGIETLHALMPYNFVVNDLSPGSLDSLRTALTGQNLRYRFINNAPYLEGSGEGILVGGNLSILYSLPGSVSDIDTHGKILFIEDVDEYLYHIDRMMRQLKRAGKLDGLNGLIVGGMTNMRDNDTPFGKSVEEIVFDCVQEYDFPVCFDFPAGHIDDNNSLIIGRNCRLSVDDMISLEFDT